MNKEIKEFREKFSPEKIWVVPSKDNRETIEDIESFWLSKLAQQKKEIASKIISRIMGHAPAFPPNKEASDKFMKMKIFSIEDIIKLIKDL